MQLIIKSLTILLLSFLMAHRTTYSANGFLLDIDADTNTHKNSDCRHTFWGWLTQSGCSEEAPDQNNRPSNRPRVLCTWWCPSGYRRRDVTIGPTCQWYQSIGKCVDSSSYVGESCGYAGKECMGNTTCQNATMEDTENNAHFIACYEEE